MLINAEEKDVLQELVNIGVGGAAVALSGIMNREVILTFPRLEIFDLEQMKQYLRNREDVQYVSVSQKVRGEFSGKGIISFTLQVLIAKLFGLNPQIIWRLDRQII